MNTKTCLKCGRTFPATPEYFHRRGASLTNKCVECTRKYWHVYQERRAAQREAVAVVTHAPPEVVKTASECSFCLYLNICRERVKQGVFVMCECCTEDDYRRILAMAEVVR